MDAKELHQEVISILRLEASTAQAALDLAREQNESHSVKTGVASWQRCAQRLLDKISNLPTE